LSWLQYRFADVVLLKPSIGRLDPALVFGDFGVDEFPAMGSEPGDSAGFVLTREEAISDDIGGENGREPTFDPLSAQNRLLEAPHEDRPAGR
jgi:hypothetical protein